MRWNRCHFFLRLEKTTAFFCLRSTKTDCNNEHIQVVVLVKITFRAGTKKKYDWPCHTRPCRARFHVSTEWFPVHRCQRCTIQRLRYQHDRPTGRHYDQDDLLQAVNTTALQRSSTDLRPMSVEICDSANRLQSFYSKPAKSVNTACIQILCKVIGA